MTETPRIAGVMRSGIFSPNHIGSDAAIFNAVADHLRRRGCRVDIYSEEQFVNSDIGEGVIVSMCRGEAAIAKLKEMERAGCLVVNSGFGIENCIRERMARLLTGCGIPYPQSLIVDTDENIRTPLTRMGVTACWVKKGDFHSHHNEDVCYCRNAEEAQEVLHEYFMRGIKRAVVNRHLEGELIKFYGVADTPFLNWFHDYSEKSLRNPSEGMVSTPFDEEAFAETCRRAAAVTELKIYGGEAVVSPDGSFAIVDLNDWPSFAPCRAKAAPVIAKEILSMIRKHRK